MCVGGVFRDRGVGLSTSRAYPYPYNPPQLPPTLQELHLSHSLPPLTTTPYGADNLGATATTGAGALGIEAGLGPLDDDGGISIGSTQGALLPVGVTLLPSLSFLPSPHDAVEAEAEEAAWAEEQEAARATTATPGATAHMVGAYLRLGQSCKGLRVLVLPRQRCVCMYVYGSVCVN